MSKGSGSIRRNTLQTTINEQPVMKSREERYDKLLDYIKKGITDDNAVIDEWDSMQNDERELALMQGGFTGILPQEGLENLDLMYPADKSNLISSMAEDISNLQNGYSMNDVSWSIGFKGGRGVAYLMDGEDTLGSLGVTARQSFSTQKAKVSTALSDKKIDFIIRQDGSSQPTYYATRTGLAALIKFTGGEVWRNGRGTKRRDYIQDDWI